MRWIPAFVDMTCFLENMIEQISKPNEVFGKEQSADFTDFTDLKKKKNLRHLRNLRIRILKTFC